MTTAETPKRSAAGILLHWLFDLAMAVLIAIVVIVFIYQPVKVEGTSMMPALVDQERIFVNKFLYRMGIGGIARGDAVVFRFPGDPSKSYIKRIVGLPGDTVSIDRGVVQVNGQPLSEDYVPPEYRDDYSMPPRALKADEFFVLGDHRNSSNDSRSWGTVPRRCIYGKAVFIYWPLDRMGLVH